MKNRPFLLTVVVTTMILAGVLNFAGTLTNMKPPVAIPKPDYHNFYGICWRGKQHENLKYARQMGYSYVFYQKGMERDTLSNGLFFYLETPEYLVYNRTLDTQKPYTPAQQKFYEDYCALKNDTQQFPYNIATGWFFTPHSFTPNLDYQQQRVINYAIDSIINYAKAIEKRNPKFHFGGLAWDVPQPAGDFWDTIQPPGKTITLKHWTGGDYGVKHVNLPQDYATYSDGHVQFYKKLFTDVRARWPNARFIMEPYHVYDEWIKVVKDLPDAKTIMPDILSQESTGKQFVEDERIFTDGLISKSDMACTSPNSVGEEMNRTLAATAAINGALFTWYGRFGGTGDMPDYKSITEVPPRLKLIRILTDWENGNHVPLNQRQWDGTTYKSKYAYAGPDAIILLQPGTSKLFITLLSMDGRVNIPPGKIIKAVYQTDNLFCETIPVNGELTVDKISIRARDSAALNKGYIVYLKDAGKR